MERKARKSYVIFILVGVLSVISQIIVLFALNENNLSNPFVYFISKETDFGIISGPSGLFFRIPSFIVLFIGAVCMGYGLHGTRRDEEDNNLEGYENRLYKLLAFVYAFLFLLFIFSFHYVDMILTGSQSYSSGDFVREFLHRLFSTSPFSVYPLLFVYPAIVITVYHFHKNKVVFSLILIVECILAFYTSIQSIGII